MDDIIIILFTAYFSLTASSPIKDEYHEELFMKPLGGYVYSYFQFSTLWEIPFLTKHNACK